MDVSGRSHVDCVRAVTCGKAYYKEWRRQWSHIKRGEMTCITPCWALWLCLDTLLGAEWWKWEHRGKRKKGFKRVDGGEGLFAEAFFLNMKTTRLLILTNTFSLCAAVIAAPHGCLKQPAKWKRQVNECVGLFISTVLMSAAQLRRNKENCVRPPSHF